MTRPQTDDPGAAPTLEELRQFTAELVMRTSLRAVAELSGASRSALHNFVRGTVTPAERNRRKLLHLWQTRRGGSGG